VSINHVSFSCLYTGWLDTSELIALDGRAGTYLDGDNGAFTALNVLMELYAPGDAVVSNR